MTEASTAQAHLPDGVQSVINGALTKGLPITVAHPDPTGAPVMSFRGSVQVYGPTRLSIWARNAEGGLAAAAAATAPVALLYRDAAAKTTLNIRGRARLASDDTERDQVFEVTPAAEQTKDPDRKGAAIVVDVERVQGMLEGAPVKVVVPGA
ncbi:hypothetical protein ACFWPQ_49450 [Streptomyces sp. NPDC058464]|uniref:hypothetical protein n=1 Tax=Streptomyces sp. NPDC058464 TaxID=3346511 RepID=UPI003659C138